MAATELATSAHPAPLPTEVARSSKSPALRPDAMVTAKPAQPSASQRFVLIGLAGLVIVALASGIAWFAVHQASPTAGIRASPTASIPAAPALSITEFPIPTVSSNATGIAAGPNGNLWFTEGAGERSGASAPAAPSPSFLSQQPTTSLMGSQPDLVALCGLPSTTRSGASHLASDSRRGCGTICELWQ